MYADVIVPLKLPGTFTYSVPEEMAVQVGCRVQVPVGDTKAYTGIVARMRDERPEGDFIIKPLLTADPEPVATGEMIRLWQWVSDYYLCPLGDVMRAAMPAKIKTAKRRRAAEVTVWDNINSMPVLTAAQQKALTEIECGGKDVCLLHGITGSGKTAIYEHLIARNPGQTLYLVPEIALTTQLEERLRDVFGNRIGVFHSKMSEAQRGSVWEKQLSDDPYPIILGARSSVFLPFRNLQLVIIDEEHEMSYKQQEPAPRYHARNVALMLAHYAGARTVLGSATPSMESFYLARRGRYNLVSLSERYIPTSICTATQEWSDEEHAVAAVTDGVKYIIADTAELRRKKMMRGMVSPVLRDAIREALERGEQAIVFQNRRGWAPHVECRDCGWTPRCLRCDVSLTMHKRLNVMVCHTCGAQYGMPVRCPSCGCTELRGYGAGTEKVEEEVRRLFPDARTSRLDLDAAKTRDDLRYIINDFESGGADILIGTQMVTKGLDFSRVSVVGIIAADTALNVPDFRAYERAYELMTQVAGRSGRRGGSSTVVIQTRQTDLPIISHVVNNDYLAHYKAVMQERIDFCYPPFCRLVNIYFKHRYENVAEAAAQSFVGRIISASLTGVEVLGPDAPAKARVANLYIRKAVMKIRPEGSISKVKEFLNGLFWEYLHSSVYKQPLIVFDVDPNN